MSIGTLVDTLRLSRRHAPPSALRDPEMHVIELKTARLRYLDTGGNGQPVVMAPDPPNTIEHHLRMVDELRKTHRVIVFDLPGFGFSYPRTGSAFDLAVQRDTLVQLLDSLHLKDSILVFSCLASFAALGAARQRPDRVAGLVLAQAPSFPDALDWARRMDNRHILGTPVLGQLMMATQGRKIADGWYRVALPKGSDTSDYFRPAETMLRHGGCYCLASAFQRFRHAEPGQYVGAEQPVTAFWGLADRTHRPSNPEGLREHVPHAGIVTLKDCGHFPDLEYSHEVIRAIRGEH